MSQEPPVREPGEADLEPDLGLGMAGEQEWRRLRQQVEMAEGFWLGFVFAPAPGGVAVLRRRTERLLQARTRPLVHLAPAQPAELTGLLARLLAPEATAAGCVWIEALFLDPVEPRPGPWEMAWGELLLRCNERRDALRRHLTGGLVLAMPPEFKSLCRETASDLWSVRALVLELTPRALRRETTRIAREVLAEYREIPDREGALPDADFALAEAERLIRKPGGDPRSPAAALLRSVAGLVDQERTGEAVKAARQAVDLLREVPLGGMVDELAALEVLSLAEEADGEIAAAEERIERALALLGSKNLGRKIRLLRRMGQLAHARGDLQRALDAYTEALTLGRQRYQAQGDTPEGLLDLSISLHDVGDVRRERGELDAALEAFEESLALRRRLRQMLGDTTQTLRGLFTSTLRLGKVQLQLGNAAAAKASLEEALPLARQCLEGDTPGDLLALVGFLERVAQAREQSGDIAGAAVARREATEIALRLATSEKPESA